MVEVGVEFMPYDEPPEVVEPADGAFDFPTASVTPELATVLCPFANTFPTVRADEINASFGKPLAQRIAIGSFVVDQLVGDVGRRRRIQQRLDKIHFGVVGCLDVDRQRQPLGVGQDHDLGPLATLGLADMFAPFLAGENVPSAKPSRQSILPRLSSLRSNRFQAWSSVPLAVHPTKRRQQVAYEGKRGGKSFQRAPLRSIHKTPSKQARGSAIGRPPLMLGLGFEKRSAISSQCSSLSSACRGSQSGSVLDPASSRDRSVISRVPFKPYYGSNKPSFASKYMF